MKYLSIILYSAVCIAAKGYSGQELFVENPKVNAPNEALIAQKTNSKNAMARDNRALQKLQDGNERFVQGKVQHLNYSAETRKALKEVQTPFCAVLACSDSRVSPEIIFDQGIGDIFIVRNAGNVASPVAKESLKYAYQVLNVPLIVVIGHQNCGAVKASMDPDTQGFPKIMSLIPQKAKQQKDLKEATILNVKAQVKAIEEYLSSIQNSAPSSITVLGAYYDFKTGKVEFL
ncbi:MAG: carbonic anhydrase [Simkaniaceae bacterium]